jgi:hypothetical protein
MNGGRLACFFAILIGRVRCLGVLLLQVSAKVCHLNCSFQLNLIMEAGFFRIFPSIEVEDLHCVVF